MTRSELAWDRIKHDDNLFTNRAQFFLIAQSILVAAAVIGITADGSVSSVMHAMTLMLMVVSVFSLAVWVWTTYRHLAARKQLRGRITDPPYNETPDLPDPGAHALMGYGIPLVFLVMWVFIVAWF